MDALEYQKQAARTLVNKPGFQLTDKEVMVVWNIVGINGEAGELSEAIKHGIFHRHGLNKEDVAEEVGDLLWYIAGLCTTLGLNMSQIMENNIAKLKKRYPDGYNEVDSLKRMDKDLEKPFRCPPGEC